MKHVMTRLLMMMVFSGTNRSARRLAYGDGNSAGPWLPRSNDHFRIKRLDQNPIAPTMGELHVL